MYLHINMYTLYIGSSIYIAKQCNQPKCPLAEELMNES